MMTNLVQYNTHNRAHTSRKMPDHSREEPPTPGVQLLQRYDVDVARGPLSNALEHKMRRHAHAQRRRRRRAAPQRIHVTSVTKLGGATHTHAWTHTTNRRHHLLHDVSPVYPAHHGGGQKSVPANEFQCARGMPVRALTHPYIWVNAPTQMGLQ
jgi:hypothetical protein